MFTPGDNQQLGIMDNKLVQSRFGRGILSLGALDSFVCANDRGSLVENRQGFGNTDKLHFQWGPAMHQGFKLRRARKKVAQPYISATAVQKNIS